MSKDPLPASNGDWPPGHIYEAVRSAIEKEWRPGEFVLASEWSAAKSHDVAGTIVRAWVGDAGGLRSIGRDEYERLAASAPSLESGYVAMRFHVCADARQV